MLSDVETEVEVIDPQFVSCDVKVPELDPSPNDDVVVVPEVVVEPLLDVVPLVEFSVLLVPLELVVVVPEEEVPWVIVDVVTLDNVSNVVEESV